MNLPRAFSPLRAEQGVLVEYTLSDVPLVLPFVFNPTTITRTRSVSVGSGSSPETRGGFGFDSPLETARASQGALTQAETLSLKVLLDATDRLNAGDPIAQQVGVQPEIDTLLCMLQPRPQTPEGARLLGAVSDDAPLAFAKTESTPVLLFKWGLQVLPVFLTQAQIEGQEYLPNLFPFRAEASLSLQVIESKNPFYEVERRRQQASAKSHLSLVGAAWDFARRL